MTIRSPLLASLLAAAVAFATAAPAFADYPPHIQSLADRCEAKGGRFDYPYCYLPGEEESESAASDQSSCGGFCKLGAALLGIAAARYAYCQAHPSECQ